MPHDFYIPLDVEHGGARPPQPKHIKFIEGVSMGMTAIEAAKYVGSADPHQYAQRVMKNEWVQLQVKELRDEMEQKMNMSRQKVQDIVTDAVDMARVQGVPADMIRGAAELNKMLGYYAPEEKIITLDSREGQIANDLETMDEDKLLELAGQELDAIEVEFEELDEIHDAES